MVLSKNMSAAKYASNISVSLHLAPFFVLQYAFVFQMFQDCLSGQCFIFYVVIINGSSYYFVLPLLSICSNVVHASDP